MAHGSKKYLKIGTKTYITGSKLITLSVNLPFRGFIFIAKNHEQFLYITSKESQDYSKQLSNFRTIHLVF